MDEHTQYANLLAIRNTELTTYWSRYNIQVLLNGGLMAAVLASNGQEAGGPPLLLVGLGGALLALLWLVMDVQGRWWIHAWNEQLKAFETANRSTIHPTFNTVLAESRRPGLRYTASAIPILFVVGWATLCLLQFGGAMAHCVGPLAVALAGHVLIILIGAWFILSVVKRLSDAGKVDSSCSWRRWLSIWATVAAGVAGLCWLGSRAINEAWSRVPPL